MNTKRKALWLAVVVAGFAMAGAARAQDEFGFEDEGAPKAKPVYENYIEVGGGYTGDGNGKFGEYTTGITDAFTDDGGFPAGSLRLSGGDDATARSWDISAGIGNGRSLDARYGIQGNFRISLYGDRIEKTEFGEARTVYGGASDTMLLPPGYVVPPVPPSITPTVSNANAAFYGDEDIVSERQIFGLEGFKHIGDAWTLSLGFENQDKSGDEVFGGNQGFSGAALVPEELDSEHQQMRARIDYADSCLQQGFEVYLSNYDAGNESIVFENAVFTGSVVSGVFRPVGLQEIATEPSNEFMRVGMDGGYTFQGHTRLSWFADWSRGEQDEDFLPIAYDSTYYPTVNLTFPYSSLDGEVERTNARLSLAGRPFRRFDYRLQYEYKDRDATHDPLQVNELGYNYNSTAPGFSSKVYDKQTQEFSLEGGYRFGGIGRLRGGMARVEMDRDTDEWEYFVPTTPAIPFYEPASFTDTTTEDKTWLELSLNPLESLTLKLRGEYNDLSADLSDETEEMVWPFYTRPGTTTPVQLVRRGMPYFLLDREQDVLELELDYELGAGASIYAEYSMVENDYDNEAMGIDSRDSDIWNVGFNWSPSEALNLSVYYSRENYEIEQHNRQMGSTVEPFADWAMDSEDEVDAAGFSVDWAVVEDRFDLTADVAYLSADSDYSSELLPGGTLVVAPTPPLSSNFGDVPQTSDELVRFTLQGIYHWNDRVDLTGRYIYEDRSAEDWSYSNDISAPVLVPPNPPATTPVASGTQANARYLAFAWERPDYNSHLFLLTVRYKF
jgi:MtrB/PioB family decaheme-associated outer membrane protein